MHDFNNLLAFKYHQTIQDASHAKQRQMGFAALR